MTVDIVEDLPRWRQRPVDAHKGTLGHVLVVAGSRGMSGAAVLCGTAALRGGAGTVQIAVPEPIQATVAVGQVCATTAGLPATEQGQFAPQAVEPLIRLAANADVLAIGPGLGRGRIVQHIVSRLVESVSCPIVLDADALNALAPIAADWRVGCPAVLTPHPGEFARLVGGDTSSVQQRRQEWAIRFAADHQVVLVLKGYRTLVTDGRRLYVNRTGNAGMATGGSGDVLTGLIAALIGQGMPLFEAAQLGTHLHGLAGDLARDELGEPSLIASDLLAYLPRAFLRLSRQP